MRPLTRDAHRPLIAALRKLIGSSDNLAALIGGGEGRPPTAVSPLLLIVESLGCEPWASATFVGQTHWLEVRLEGHPQAVETACRALESQLADAEFDVCGTIVADVAVNTGAPITRADGVQYCCLRLEILTIDD